MGAECSCNHGVTLLVGTSLNEEREYKRGGARPKKMYATIPFPEKMAILCAALDFCSSRAMLLEA